MAAALQLVRHRLAAPPPPPLSPMLRSLFPACYSKAAAADDSLPAVCRAAMTPPPTSLSRHYCRDVFPRKAPPPKDGPRCCTPVPNTVSEGTKSLLDRLKDLKAAANSLPAMCRVALTLPPPSLSQQYYKDVFPRKTPPPKDEPRRCSTVPKITSDGTKSLLGQLKDLKDSMKALQDRKTNLEKHQEMISKEVHDCMISNDLFKVRLAGHIKLAAKIHQLQVGSRRMDMHAKWMHGLGGVCGHLAEVARGLGHGHGDGARGLGHGLHGRSCNSQLGERIQFVPMDSSDDDGARHLCYVRGCGGDGGGMLSDRARSRGDMGDGSGVRDVMGVQCTSVDSGKANKDQCVAAEPGVADCCKEEVPDSMDSDNYELAYAPDTYDENTKDIYWPLMKIYLPDYWKMCHIKVKK